MSRIKLLAVFASLDVGGAEVQLSMLLSRLDRSIFEVHAAYYDPRAGFPKDTLEQAGIPVHFLGRSAWSRWHYLVDAIRFMRRERFDVVHCVQHSTNFYGWIPALFAQVPVIACGLQGMIELERYWPHVYALASSRCSGWIVNSDALKDYAEKCIPFLRNRPFFVVPNGIDMIPDPALTSDTPDYYKQLRGNRKVVGIVGRLQQVKNHKMFLEMARELITSGCGADFWIIGKGPLREALENTVKEFQIEDRVRFLGFRRDVPVALDNMDLFVLTSDSESCPNALLEAMRAGLPVISTRCTDLSEIIYNDHNGFVIDLGDTHSLAIHAKKILDNHELAVEMGRCSRLIVEEKFSMARAVERLQDAYLALALTEIRRSPALMSKLQLLGRLPANIDSGEIYEYR